MEEEKKEAVVEDTTEATTPAADEAKGTNKTNVIALVVVVILILGALQMSGKISLGGDPTLATVNGEAISQSELDLRIDQIANSPQAQLINLEDPEVRASIEEQILQEIINTRLLLANAAEAGYEATDEEVQAEYDLAVQQFGDETILGEELKNNGLTKATFLSNLSDQLTIEKYLETLISLETITATEEEVQEFYAQISDQEGVPALEEIRVQLEAQITQQKQQAEVGQVLETIRTDADIEILN